MPVEICPPLVEHFSKPFTARSEKTFKELGTVGAQIVKEIMAVPGVKSLEIRPKEVRVKKEPHVSWEQIEKKVFRILKSFMRRKSFRLVKR
ncbi:MAG: NifU N-terminal domain-containing protein [Deltaproteobacteria bacterium]|nr:NifU N-terminal domain-containing protein [Deltaproteobacteria bacterium]